MALTRALIPIYFKGGLDQKTPEKLRIPGTFTVLENCVRRKVGMLQKRYGFRALSRTIFGTSTELSDGKHIDTFQNDLIQINNGKLYSYSPANDAWIDKGSCTTTAVSLSPLLHNQNSHSQADSATAFGLTITVYEDSSGGCRYSVYDDETGAAVVYDTVLNASAVRPKVISTQSGFVIGYLVSAKIVSRFISHVTPTTLGTAVDVIGSGVSTTAWDLDSYSTYGTFAYNNTGSTITVGYIDQTGHVGSPGSNTLPAPVATVGTGTAANCLTLLGDTTNSKIWLAYHGSAGVIRVRAYSPDLSTAAQSDIETVANVRNAGLVVRSSDAQVRLFYEISAASVKDHFVKQARVSWPGSGSITIQLAAVVFNRSVGMASKPFETDGRHFIYLVHQSIEQSTYFLLRDDGETVAKVLGLEAGGLSADAVIATPTLKSGLPRVMSDSTDKYVVALQKIDLLTLTSAGAIASVRKGLERVSLSFDATLYGRTLGKNYHIPGAVLLAYDGAQVNEHNFFIFPEDTTVAKDATAGTLVASPYSIQTMYEWMDAQGQTHRSAPSPVQTITPDASKSILVTIPTLRITNRTASEINIVVYMSEVNTTTPVYRVATVANDSAVNTVTALISAPAVTTNEILYTTGGIVENIVAPACTAIHAHKGRLFSNSELDDGVHFTKVQVPGEGVAFQDLRILPVDSGGGPITAYASLDDKLLVFKSGRIFYLSGEGPTDALTQDDYFVPIRIASDVGTVEPLSIIEMPMGVMFKSDKGFALVTRALTVDSEIGSPATDMTSLVITGATVLAEEQEVRFTCADGDTQVYNYQFNQWSTFSNHEATSSCNALSAYCHLKSDGTVMVETTEYSDNGNRIVMAIETSWLAWSGIQGFQRIYRMLMLGDFISHCIAKVKIAYDYENAYNQTIYFNTQTGLVSSSVYGEGDTYGDATPYGGTGSTVFQFRFRPRRQKCEAIKLRIEDIDTISDAGDGSFTLVSITAEVGRKYGAKKLPARKTAG